MATADAVLCYNQTWLSGPSYWLPNENFTCANWDLCYCPVIEADPDVAGIGVVVSFMASALLTLILTIAWILLSRDVDPAAINPIDKWMDERICDPLQNWIGPDRASRAADCLRDVILSFSDSQLVTGIAMLASAVKLLNDGTIVVYHFNIVTDLAWFSSNVHLLSLRVITNYLEDDNRANTPGPRRYTNKDVLRLVRIALMLALAGLLLYCVWISGYSDWYSNAACPVSCIRDRLQKGVLHLGGKPRKWLIVNYVFILFGYPVSTVYAFPRARRTIRRFVKPVFEALTDQSRWPTWVWYLNWMLCGVIAFFDSDLDALLEGVVWFALGMYWTVGDRNLIHGYIFPNGTPAMSDKEWAKLGSFGFGQLVPLVLLLLPILTVIESWKMRNSVPPGTPGKTP
ncbi:MAG: hypothetical protein M1820_001648 [Bogoriella megaspora]|nr:MAG: hypothetical protein M1820_001648 [Bogoriella megaspora]